MLLTHRTVFESEGQRAWEEQETIMMEMVEEMKKVGMKKVDKVEANKSCSRAAKIQYMVSF